MDRHLSVAQIKDVALIQREYPGIEIADRLSLAEGTVKNYVTNILGKLGARDRTRAAIRARELGLI